jgi:glucokinase
VTAAVGVDVGGTKCLGVLLIDGSVEHELRRQTVDGAALFDVVAEMMLQLAAEATGLAPTFGIGIAGLVDRNGVLRESPHLSLDNRANVAELLAAKVGTKVAVDNDATTAALAEWTLGAGRGAHNVACVSLGTGIGIGLIVDERLVHGANGYAGELGHMTVERNGPMCACGGQGCWELFASGSALSAAANNAGFRPESLAEAARSGEASALAVIDNFADQVCIGLASIVYALDPELIVVGGGVATVADLLIPRLNSKLQNHVYGSNVRELPRVVGAQLGEHAAAIGAALLA